MAATPLLCFARLAAEPPLSRHSAAAVKLPRCYSSVSVRSGPNKSVTIIAIDPQQLGSIFPLGDSLGRALCLS